MKKNHDTLKPTPEEVSRNIPEITTKVSALKHYEGVGAINIYDILDKLEVGVPFRVDEIGRIIDELYGDEGGKALGSGSIALHIIVHMYRFAHVEFSKEGGGYIIHKKCSPSEMVRVTRTGDPGYRGEGWIIPREAIHDYFPRGNYQVVEAFEED